MAQANVRSNGSMKGKWAGGLKEGLEHAQTRLQGLEKEAAKVLGEVKARGKSSRKEIAGLLEKLQAGELFETAREKEKELVTRAGKLGTEMAKRLDGLHDRLLKVAGVATREQMNEILAELDKLSRRLDRLAKPAKGKRRSKGQNGVSA